MRWLTGHYGIEASVITDSGLLTTAISNSHWKSAQWLVARFGQVVVEAMVSRAQERILISPAVARADVLKRACVTGNLAMARWVADRFDVIASDVRETSLLHRLTQEGTDASVPSASILEWLISRFKVTSMDVRADDCAPFRAACSRGNLPAARLLADLGRLAEEGMGADPFIEARIAAIESFIGACGGGSLEVAQWLVEYFSLSPADVRAKDHAAFRAAQWGSHSAVKAWLLGRYYHSSSSGSGIEPLDSGPPDTD